MPKHQIKRFTRFKREPFKLLGMVLNALFHQVFVNTGIALIFFSIHAVFPYMAKLRHTLGLVLPSPALPWKLSLCALFQENVVFFSMGCIVSVVSRFFCFLLCVDLSCADILVY